MSAHRGFSPKPWLALPLICLCSGVLLGAANAVTAPILWDRAQAAAGRERLTAFPAAEAFREMELPEGAPLSACAAALIQDQTAGYVGSMTVNGYKGPIELTLGVDSRWIVTGLTVGGTAFMETAGLGAKVQEAAFTSQFTGLCPPAVLGGNVEGVSGATISSGAVTAGVNKILQSIRELSGEAVKPSAFASILAEAGEELSDAEAVDAAYRSETGYVVVVTEQGFHGPIRLAVALNQRGAVAGVGIDENDFTETAGLGERVLEETFLSQFVGKDGVVGLRPVDAATAESEGKDEDAVSGATAGRESAYDEADGASSATGVVEIIENADYVIDAVSGATISSTAVAKAVNRAIAFVQTLLPAPQASNTNTGGTPS